MQAGRQVLLSQKAAQECRYLRFTACLIMSDFAYRGEINFKSVNT